MYHRGRGQILCWRGWCFATTHLEGEHQPKKTVRALFLMKPRRKPGWFGLQNSRTEGILLPVLNEIA